MKKTAERTKDIGSRKGLRAIMITMAVLALACVALACVPSLTDTARVSARAHSVADRIAPVMFRYSYNVTADAEGNALEAPRREEHIVSCDSFVYKKGEVTAIEGLTDGIAWDDPEVSPTLERLPLEKQGEGAWRINRFWFRAALLAPWIASALLLLIVFGLIGAVVSRELRTLGEVAQALGEAAQERENGIKPLQWVIKGLHITYK